MKAFAQPDRFISEVKDRKLKAGYLFIGDEAFFRKRCRDAVLSFLVPTDMRDFALYDFDLSETELYEVLIDPTTATPVWDRFWISGDLAINNRAVKKNLLILSIPQDIKRLHRTYVKQLSYKLRAL